MPAAKVVGTVTRVKILVEVYRYEITDRLFHQQLFHLLRFSRVAGIECYGDLPARALLGIEYGLALMLVCAERLFGNYVAAKLKRADDVAIVGRVNRGHDDCVRLDLLNHTVEIHEGRSFDSYHALCRLDPFGIYIAQTDDIDNVAIIVDNGLPPRQSAARPRANNRYSEASGVGQSLRQAANRNGRRSKSDPAFCYELASSH